MPNPDLFSLIRFPRVPRRAAERPRRSTRGYNPPPRWGERWRRHVDGERRGSEARVAVLDLHCRGKPRPSFGDWYFPSPKGSRCDVDNFSQDLRAANHKAGLTWTCLDYRHTFGSQLAMKGESL